MKTTIAAVGAVLALAALSGCSGRPEPAATVTVPGPTVTATVTVTATPSKPATLPNQMLRVGDTFESATVALTVTGETATSEFDSQKLKAWEVKACNTSAEEVGVGSARWMAVTDDDARLNPHVIYGDAALEPAYPSSSEDDRRGDLAPGECVKGFIPFDDRGVIELRYENADGEKASWGVE